MQYTALSFIHLRFLSLASLLTFYLIYCSFYSHNPPVMAFLALSDYVLSRDQYLFISVVVYVTNPRTCHQPAAHAFLLVRLLLVYFIGLTIMRTPITLIWVWQMSSQSVENIHTLPRVWAECLEKATLMVMVRHSNHAIFVSFDKTIWFFKLIFI